MPVFEHIPLGAPIPDSPHAVSCSLPTMESVRGYEEKRPEVVGLLKTGYPRFVVHPFARRLAAELASRGGLAGRTLWLTSSRRMAGELLAHVSAAAPDLGLTPFEAGGVHGVSHPDSPDVAQRCKLYLQHVGGFLSSREAEDRLAEMGAGPAPAPEALFEGDAESEVRRHLGPMLSEASAADLFLTNSGMNAVFSAFSAVNDVQAARGRTAWVQLGWLYLDTIAILKKFTPSAADYVHVRSVTDLAAIRELFERRGHEIAGVLAEIPSNPLVQTPDLAALARLCRSHGVRLVLDPSLGSVFSIDALPHADLLATSLTKYTGGDGDLIAGAVAVNPRSPDAGALRRSVASRHEAPYARDLRRLAAQVGHTRSLLDRIEEGTPRVAAFLGSHPRVRSVHWALEGASREHYLEIARSPRATGGMISFSLRGPLEPFYDRLRLPKGPSFGMRTTLICPFMYLAHYDLVTTDEGRAQLEANGLDPDLLRLCVGTEPAEDIIEALREALG